jgi:serine/threonine-protein kinase
MGEIYRATDDTLGRAVAVKVLAERFARDESLRERFTREALAAARLSGEPHTVTIFDVGEWNERPFIVMEYLAGGSLEDTIRKDGVVPAGQAITWLEQAASALDAAHRHGVVHRDVKPGNLLLDRNGSIHVADFGIASAAGLDSMTQPGTVLGTAGYLSPEQASGDRATPASDRYALAIVAFELLAGRRPFEAESPTAEAAAHIHAEIPSVCDRKAELPCELDPVFARALAKDPGARYDTCEEFVADLRHTLHEAAGKTGELAPVPTAVTVRTPPARGAPLPWLPLLLGAAVLGGLVLAFALTRGGGKPAPAPKAQTLVKTVTAQGTTVVTTVPAPTTPTTAPAPPSGASGTALTDQATGLIRQGRYTEALPIAQQALAKLEGTGQAYEAYANYDAGTSLVALGRCAEALPYLAASEAIQGPRKEIDRDRKRCRE